jgi:hypothetical protein
MCLKGPSRYSVSIFWRWGQSVTRLPKRSRNTLKLITRSASITSPPGIGRRDRMRAAEFQGRNFGYDSDIGHQIVHLLGGIRQARVSCGVGIRAPDFA